MPDAEDTLDPICDLLDLPEEEEGLEADQNKTPYYRNWGFTIYRTCYTPSSAEKWSFLLDDIRNQAKKELGNCEGVGSDNPAYDELWSLFRLDVRSDPTTLDGLDIDALREVYKRGETTEIDGRRTIYRRDKEDQNSPMNTSGVCQRRVFLVADEEVLDSPPNPEQPRPELYIKVVEADYVYKEPINTRAGPQSYFGWMRMTTASLMGLWNELEGFSLDDLAPKITPKGKCVKCGQFGLWDGTDPDKHGYCDRRRAVEYEDKGGDE